MAREKNVFAVCYTVFYGPASERHYTATEGKRHGRSHYHSGEEYGMADSDYLFPSRKHRSDGTARHIDRRAAYNDMKAIQKKFALNFPFGCHSVRKTHGYMRYKYIGDPIEVLRLHFNHADEATTRRYIGIDEEERAKGLMKLHGGSYRPPKAEHPTKRKNVSGVELEIERQDREENGRLWGLAKQEASNRRKQKAEQEALKKKQRSEYDRDRYKRRKEQEAVEKAKQAESGEAGKDSK